MIGISNINAKSFYVVGLGRSGIATARALLASGAEVHAWDDNESARAKLQDPAIKVTAPEDLDWTGISALVLSPGIPHTYPAPHAAAALAKQSGTPIIGDVDLLAQSCEAATFIGITGTNGKSTTTALLGHILEACGLDSVTAGNIGRPVLDLDMPGQDTKMVLELSSYQLETAPSLSCGYAVLLNMSADHIDRHGDMDGYIAAKRRLIEQQPAGALTVIGADDEVCREIATSQTDRRILQISGHSEVPGGVYVSKGILIDDRAGQAKAIVDLNNVATLPGDHNAQNAAAAYAIAAELGCSAKDIAAAIATFPGLAHRQELVGTLNGVAYVNDSKATNADAASRALSCYDPIYWIAGGRAKEGGITPLKQYFPRIRHAYLIGEAADDFAATLTGETDVTVAGEIAQAVRQAHDLAQSEKSLGGTVLLSPAAASFDQFASFEARGDVFRAEVQTLIGRAVA